MQKLVDRLFADLGAPALLQRGSTAIPVQVHMRPRQKGKLQRLLTPMGDLPQGQYSCYLQVPVAVGDVVVLGSRRYQVSRWEALRGPGGRVYYYWALCLEKEGEGECIE